MLAQPSLFHDDGVAACRTGSPVPDTTIAKPRLSPASRARLYSDAFPAYPPLHAGDRWLDGMWILGNNYRDSSYRGAYPSSYLKRVMAIFPEANSVLHLFSGALPPGPYVRFDIREDVDADVHGNAEDLSQHFPPGHFDLILADPPYTAEDADHYGQRMVSRNRVVKECVKVLKPGGALVWLDQVLPMFRNTDLHLWGLIGIVRPTNHRFRVVSLFERVAAASAELGDGEATEPTEGQNERTA